MAKSLTEIRSIARSHTRSAVNDSGRAMMAAIAKYRDDIVGAIVTSGTATAYAVLSYQGFDSLAHLSGQAIAFTPHITNADTVSLNVDGLGAKPLHSAPGIEVSAGTLIQGTPYTAVYNNADAAFYLHGVYGSPYNVPFLAGLDYWDTVTPNSSFIVPAGQAISRTVYSKAFARWGTKFGAGDGSTTFNVPDKTGRVSAMMEALATRLTSSVSGIDGATMGSVGGVQSKTLVTANLPPYTPSGSNGTVTVTSTRSDIAITDVQAGLAGGGSVLQTVSNFTAITSTGSGPTFIGAAQGGSSTPFAIVPPTIVCNYIIRII